MNQIYHVGTEEVMTQNISQTSAKKYTLFLVQWFKMKTKILKLQLLFYINIYIFIYKNNCELNSLQ